MLFASAYLFLLGLCQLILAFSPFCFQGFWSSLLSLFWIIFQVVCLFPSSFIWTSVFLVCSFICVVFLCLFIIIFFNLLCLRSPFLKPQGWILPSFWFLPSYVWSNGLCEFGWDLCWVFVCLFFSLVGKAEWGGNPLYWWLGFCFVLFVQIFSTLSRVLLVVEWCQVLYSSGFLYVSSHYLILPRINSLVV